MVSRLPGAALLYSPRVSMPRTPEQRARRQIDEALVEAGWIVQDREALNLAA